MSGVKLLTVAVVVVAIVGVALGLFLFSPETESAAPPGMAMMDEIPHDMGISYLPVTEGVADYYGLGVRNGALVTEVAPDSPAGRAGVMAGDVILSFNGDTPREQAPLLGMMMACPVGQTVRLEIWRQEQVQTLEFVHWQR
ncbi:MAG TPA: PDZ domain-containing protein [Dehalococcoidales bacterium]|nr:MAG: hypothetical protein A2Z05_04730 [Chloroflexi bacterium RBG_16_60_22]HJX12788.1 PDZ domain-containing protein [Dehalococcoidales bacterium]